MTGSRRPVPHQSVPSQNNPTRANAGPVPFQRARPPRNSSLHSQADTRHPILAYDQHGRQWSMQVENRTGQPTGLITNDFNAPWLPDQKYLIINPENTSELWIDYRLMGLERRTALRAYHDLAVALSADKSWVMPQKVGEYSADVRRVLGRPPQPLEPVRAAVQENPWILGFTEAVDPQLAAFVLVPDEMIMEFGDDVVDFSEDAYLERTVPGLHRAPTPAPVSDAGRAQFRERSRPAVAEDLADFEDLDGDDDAGDDAGDEADGTDEPPLDAAPTDSVDDLLDELEAASDPTLVGGRTIAPDAAERAERQAPRREGSTAQARKKAISRGGRSRTMPSLRERQATAAADAAKGAPKRATLADGARPGVSAAGFATEHQRPMPEE